MCPWIIGYESLTNQQLDVLKYAGSTQERQPDRHQFNSLFLTTTWVSRHQRGIANLDFNQARDDEVAVASAGPLCKSFAPRSRQTTTPAPHHSFLMGQMLFLTPNQQCESTESNTEGKTHSTLNNTFITIPRCKLWRATSTSWSTCTLFNVVCVISTTNNAKHQQ